MNEITLEQYERALDLLQKVPLAKRTVEAYEEQQRYKEDPISEIVEKGVMTVVAFEVIDKHSICRVTKYRYQLEGKIAERTITYLNPVTERNFLAIKEDKTVLI